MNAVIQSVADFYRSSGSVNSSPSYFVPENLDQNLEPSSSNSPDKSKAAPKKLEFRSSKKRILVLTLYVIQALFQLYSVFSLLPIASFTNQKPASSALGTQKPSQKIHVNEDFALADINCLGLIFFLTVLFLSYPLSQISYFLSLKSYLITGSAVSSISLVIRSVIFSMENLDPSNVVNLYITQFMCSVGTCITLLCPSLISVKWFPSKERRLATGLCLLSIFVGWHLSYNILVLCETVNENFTTEFNSFEIMFMAQGLVGCVFTITLVCVFPNKQTRVTSILQLSQRFSVRSSCYQVLSKSRFWVTMVSYLLMACSLCFFMYYTDIIKSEKLRNFANGYDSNNLALLGNSLVAVLIAVVVLKTSSMLYTVFPIMLGLHIFYCIFQIIVAFLCFFPRESSTHVRAMIVSFVVTLTFASFKTMSALFIEFMADFMYPVREQTTYSICISTLFLPYIGRHFLLAYEGPPSFETAKIFCSAAVICAISGTLIFLSLIRTENNRHKAYWSSRRVSTFRGPAKLIPCEEEPLLRSSK